MGQKLPTATVVLVGDGSKFVLLRNEGDALYPDLRIAEVIDAPWNPPARSHDADRPGRVSYRGRRSAFEARDGHADAERRFTRRVAEQVSARAARKDFPALVVVAPPRVLANLRTALGAAARRLILAEIPRDLVHRPIHEIEGHVLSHA